MVEIKWEEPEKSSRGTGGNAGAGKWQRVARELAQRPGVWALVGEDVSTSVAAVLKKHGAEATMRGIAGSRASKVYARWPEG